MQALVLDTTRATAVVQSHPIPATGDGEILIRVHSIALNPVDALYTTNPLASSGRVVGSDFSGVVVESSADSRLVGQRVAGFVQGACSVNDRPGAFAEFTTSPSDLVWQIRDDLTFEEAATTSLCALTAAQAIHYRLGLPAPFDWNPGSNVERAGDITPRDGPSPKFFFIYGASTSVAMYAAQLVHHSAKWSKRLVKLIGAASKGRFAKLYATPYSYDLLVDYRDEKWPDKVREFTGGTGVDWAYDCISEGQTVQQVSKTLHPEGRLAIVRSRAGGAWEADDLTEEVNPIYGAVWEGLGVDILYQGFTVHTSPEARRFAVAFYAWLSSGSHIEPNQVRLMPGGLERIVPDGFTLLGAGTMEERSTYRTEPWMQPIASEKLVYRLQSAYAS
jgi:NADPH:quinone reductase-like Zn-dependent oxidoreductase